MILKVGFGPKTLGKHRKQLTLNNSESRPDFFFQKGTNDMDQDSGYLVASMGTCSRVPNSRVPAQVYVTQGYLLKSNILNGSCSRVLTKGYLLKDTCLSVMHQSYKEFSHHPSVNSEFDKEKVIIK